MVDSVICTAHKLKLLKHIVVSCTDGYRSVMDNLPDEIVLEIGSRCQVSDLQRIALVSKQFNRIAQELRKGLYCINELEEQSLWYNYSLCHYIAHATMEGRVRTTFTHRPWSTKVGQNSSSCPLQAQAGDIVICANLNMGTTVMLSEYIPLDDSSSEYFYGLTALALYILTQRVQHKKLVKHIRDRDLNTIERH